MAKQIIILDDIPVQQGVAFSYAMWAAVPVARQPKHANPNATSAYQNATAAELTALRNGEVIERVETAHFVNNETNAQIRASLVQSFTAFQNQVNFNRWSRYGTFYDGVTWTAAGVA
jgi:hypothetical protein